jgi:hypothetical protein
MCAMPRAEETMRTLGIEIMNQKIPLKAIIISLLPSDDDPDCVTLVSR